MELSWDRLLDGTLRKQYEQGSREELVQQLLELGYLLEAPHSDGESHHIGEALLCFQKELMESRIQLHQSQELYPNYQDFNLNLLTALTGLESGLAFSKVPKIGECSLWSRIALYRLEVMGLHSVPASAPFSAGAFADLQEFAVLLECTPLQALNLLGNLPELTDLLKNKWGDEAFLTFFRYDGENTKKLELTQKFIQQLRKDFSRKSETFQEFRKEIWHKRMEKRDFTSVEKRIRSRQNQIILRLLQVRQWMDGIYQGNLDSEMGPLTIQSILDLHRLEFETGNHTDLWELLVYIGEEYYAFNSLYFFNRYYSCNKEDDTEKNAAELLEEQLSQASQANDQDLTNNLDNLFQEELKERQASLQKGGSYLRRIYQGGRSLLLRITRFASHLFRWIKNLFREALQLIKSWIRIVYREIRQGLQLFCEGLSFLFGKRTQVTCTSSNRMILSHFDADCDSLLIVPDGVSRADLIQHMTRLNQNIRSLRISLLIIAMVIRWIETLIVPLSWPLLAVRIARSFRTMVREIQAIQPIKQFA